MMVNDDGQWQFQSLSIDNSFIHNSIFKATTGILSLARAGVKGILGDDNRSVIVQIIDELVNGKYVIMMIMIIITCSTTHTNSSM